VTVPPPESQDAPCTPRVRIQDPNRVAKENELPGTTDWKIAQASSVMHAFASPYSVLPGDTVNVMVNSTKPWFTANVYRLGWYGGAGAREVLALARTNVSAQPDVVRVNDTNMVYAPWSPTTSFVVGEDWTTGVYLVKLTASGGSQTYAPFVVRDPQHDAELLYHTSEFTWEAYNGFGGSSLYASTFPGVARAFAVSFERPYQAKGDGDLERWELPMIQFLERTGRSVDYVGDVDLSRDPSIVHGYDGILTVGHDEYVSASMRAALEQARASCISLAIFGGNTMYWKVRTEPSPDGSSMPVVVCYKDARDPLAADVPNATGRWRQAPTLKPEGALLGSMYELGSAEHPAYTADLVLNQNASAVFKGIVLPGQKVPGVVGNEWDRFLANGSNPRAIVLSDSPAQDANGTTSLAQASIYAVGHGAFVFNAASEDWSRGLSFSPPDDGVVAITNALLDAMLGLPTLDISRGP
jgi:hypothetical protein